MNRYNTIDLFRLIAAFFILLVHTEYGDLNQTVVNILRISARWAVPFFFIASGFFLEKKTTGNTYNLLIIEGSLKKLISILIISSIIYIPANIILNYYYYNIETLLTGSFIHLWFIGSLIFGNIFIWYLNKIKKEKILPYLSVFILTIALISDTYDILFNINLKYNLPRFLLSIPFMFIGSVIAKKETKILTLNKKKLLITFLFLYLLQFYEAFLLSKYYNQNSNSIELLIGTVLSPIILFTLLITIQYKKKQISILGKKYSLWIYLYHPFIYIIINKINYYLFQTNISNSIQVFNPIICFILSLLLSILLEKRINKLFKISIGDIV